MDTANASRRPKTSAILAIGGLMTALTTFCMSRTSDIEECVEKDDVA